MRMKRNDTSYTMDKQPACSTAIVKKPEAVEHGNEPSLHKLFVDAMKQQTKDK